MPNPVLIWPFSKDVQPTLKNRDCKLNSRTFGLRLVVWRHFLSKFWCCSLSYCRHTQSCMLYSLFFILWKVFLPWSAACYTLKVIWSLHCWNAGHSAFHNCLLSACMHVMTSVCSWVIFFCRVAKLSFSCEKSWKCKDFVNTVTELWLHLWLTYRKSF